MPKIPIYQAQLGASRATTATVESGLTYMPFVNAVNRTGGMLENRGAQLLQEYDTTRAYTAFNQLRETSRNKMAELMSREGIDAQGAQQEYTEFYKKAQADVTKNTINAFSQRQLFDRLSQSHQAGDLDQLARHEYVEHKKNVVSVVNGFMATTNVDIGESAHDFDKVDGMIYGRTEADGTITPGLWGAIDSLGSGLDRTATKLKATEEARYTQVDSLISSDTQKATVALEKYKSELGEKYGPLKKRLEEQTKADEMTAALGYMQTRFGSNYEAAAHYASQQSKFGEWGGDFKKSREFISYFNGLASQREREENHAITRHKRQLEDSDFKFWIAVNDPDPSKPRPDAVEWAKNGRISQQTFLAYQNKKESATADNTAYYLDVYSRALRGEDVRKDVIDANGRVNPLLSDASAKSIGKMVLDDAQKDAYKDIKDAIDPGNAERSPDRALKYYDANKKLEARIAAGENPRLAAAAVISEYSQDLRRSWGTLPLNTENFKGNRKDPDAVRVAMQMVAGKMNAAKTPAEFDKYRLEYDTLQKMLDKGQQQLWVDDALEQKRQEDKKKLPGGKY